MHYRSRPAWRYQCSAVIAAIVMVTIAVLIEIYGPAHVGVRAAHMVLGAALALAVYFLLLALYRHFAWRYLIDEHNIESYWGLLARHVQSIRIADLRNVNVRQTIMQRILDVGDVEFSSAAGTNVEVVFFGVTQPMRVKELVRRVQDGAPPAAAD